MKIPAFRLPILFFLATLLGCTQLGTFNTLVPQDGGAALEASGIAYGPHPRQKLDFYAPEGGGAAKGTVVFVYGGSWSSGRRQDYGFVGRALASRGYAVVLFDYRLVPQVRYPAFVEDAAKAVAWTRRNAARHGGNPNRIFLAGHSAGAYNAMMVALAPEFLRTEGLSPSIIRGVAGLSGPYDFLPLDTRATREAFGKVADLPRTQPVNRVTRAAPPVFLATGDADTTVSPRHTNSLAKRLREAGIPVRTKTYPGAGHAGTLLALSRAMRGNAPVLDDLVGFFDGRR